jgi:hypothetical protein
MREVRFAGAAYLIYTHQILHNHGWLKTSARRSPNEPDCARVGVFLSPASINHAAAAALTKSHLSGDFAPTERETAGPATKIQCLVNNTPRISLHGSDLGYE